MRHLLVVLVALLVAPAAAQAQQSVRLAAPSDCLANPGCGAGLKRVYKLDVSKNFAPLAVADAGISALDDGIGQVAIAFSSSPDAGRADIVELRDDKGMIGSDHIVPVVRRKAVDRVGKGMLRALDEASALLSSTQLRSMNQQVSDGRLAEAVGAEFVEANGLGGPKNAKRGKRVVVGYQPFEENEVLGHIYAEALRVHGYDARMKLINGLRPQAVKAVKTGAVDLYPSYSRSITDFLLDKQVLTADVRPELRKALATIGARPAALAPATDQNVFVMKRTTAQELGISKISDLGKFWPAAS